MVYIICFLVFFLTFTEKTCYFAPVMDWYLSYIHSIHSILVFKVNLKLEIPFLKIKKYLFSLYASMVKWMLTLKNMVLFKKIERVLKYRSCYVLFLIHTAELFLLSCFHLCKSFYPNLSR